MRIRFSIKKISTYSFDYFCDATYEICAIDGVSEKRTLEFFRRLHVFGASSTFGALPFVSVAVRVIHYS